MERLVEGGRHIEVQIIADNHGNAWAPGVRDCSIQRRNQKLIEESSSPALTPEQDADAARGGDRAGQGGRLPRRRHGRVPVPARGEAVRLPRGEHPAAGRAPDHRGVHRPRPGQAADPRGRRAAGSRASRPAEFGHAIEARLNAEDADNGFAPSPGKVELLPLPTGPGIRVDTGIGVGDVISPDYDSMVAKIIAWGRDRPEAMARLRVALRETTVVVKRRHDDQVVPAGPAGPAGGDRRHRGHRLAGPRRHRAAAPAPTPPTPASRCAVASMSYEAEEARERDSFLASARGGRPRAPHGRPGGRAGLPGPDLPPERRPDQPDRYRVEVAGRRRRGRDRPARRVREPADRRRPAAPRSSRVDHRRLHLVEVDSVSHRVSRDEGGVVRSPAPAVVVAVCGPPPAQEVEAGDTVMILETMKMETPVKAPYAGRVREILAGSTRRSTPAARCCDRPGRRRGRGARPPTVGCPRPATPRRASRGRGAVRCAALRALIMGYDVSGSRAGTGRGLQLGARASRRSTTRSCCAPSSTCWPPSPTCASCPVTGRPARRRRRTNRCTARGSTSTPTCTRWTSSGRVCRRASAPGWPRRCGTTGSTDLNRARRWRRRCYRIFLAQERVADQFPTCRAARPVAVAVELAAGSSRAAVGEVLERLVVATRLRYPAVGDLARAMRFGYFEGPVIKDNRQVVLDGAARSAELDPVPGVAATTTRHAPGRGAGRQPRAADPAAGPSPELDHDGPDPIARGDYPPLLPHPRPGERALARCSPAAPPRHRRLRPAPAPGCTCSPGWARCATCRPPSPRWPARRPTLQETGTRLLDLYVSWPDRPADPDALVAELRRMVAEARPATVAAAGSRSP